MTHCELSEIGVNCTYFLHCLAFILYGQLTDVTIILKRYLHVLALLRRQSEIEVFHSKVPAVALVSLEIHTVQSVAGHFPLFVGHDPYLVLRELG